MCNDFKENSNLFCVRIKLINSNTPNKTFKLKSLLKQEQVDSVAIHRVIVTFYNFKKGGGSQFAYIFFIFDICAFDWVSRL